MASAPRAVVLMGVAGSGKTTVGRALAQLLGWCFLDADDLHSPASIEKMRHGVGLDDADRAAWLDAVAAAIAARIAEGRPTVIACSALKRSYRDRLVRGQPSVAIAFLDASPDLLRRRLAARRGHFAGPSLLASQLATLESPAPDEGIARVDADRPPEEIGPAICRTLGLEPRPRAAT